MIVGPQCWAILPWPLSKHPRKMYRNCAKMLGVKCVVYIFVHNLHVGFQDSMSSFSAFAVSPLFSVAAAGECLIVGHLKQYIQLLRVVDMY